MGISNERLDILRAECANRGLNAFLIRDTSNISWLTAFDGVFDSEQAHALYVDPRQAVLHTDSRYVTACERSAQARGGAVTVSAERVSHAKFASALWASRGDSAEEGCAVGGAAQSHGAAQLHGATADTFDEPLPWECSPAPARTNARLGIEDAISLAEFRALEKAFAEGEAAAVSTDATATDALGATGAAPTFVTAPEPAATPAATPAPALASVFVETSGVVLSLRAVKDETEIARMRTAQAITDAALDHILGFMRPGLTEREVQLELEDYMVRHGASCLAFPSIVATGANGASPHAIPGETVLQAGQCVVLDFGARAQGYCSDMTRTIFLGQPDAEMRAAWETMRRANEEVQAMLRPGVTGKQAHELAEEILKQGGFGGRMGHGLGHGVGIDIHEEPVLSPRNEAPLVAGNVVTVEPGIYIPGRFGMRLEDFGVVTETGFDRFTCSTHEMIVL